MPIRKISLVTEEVYHIYSRSIAKFIILNSDKDYERIIDTIDYYSVESPPCKFSLFKELDRLGKAPYIDRSKKIVTIIAYCIMPTHLHIILKEIKDGGIAIYMKRILESYAKYFNVQHGRKGPLWESRFQNVLVESNNQLIHLTRYIHLNPVTSFLVNNPEKWPYSSYKEYITNACKRKICSFDDFIEPAQKQHYYEFVNNQIDYQRELNLIKKHLFHAGYG